MRSFVVAAALVLASCHSAGPEQTGKSTPPAGSFVGPDGRPTFAIKCNGTARSIGNCYKRAGQLCPSGYDVVDQSEHGGAFGTINGGNGVIVPTARRSLLVACKTP